MATACVETVRPNTFLSEAALKRAPTYVENVRPNTLPSGAALKKDPIEVASAWIAKFQDAAKTSDHEKFDYLISTQGFWRDVISFTNDFRSVAKPNIHQAARDIFTPTSISNIRLDSSRPPTLQNPFPDYFFVESFFKFDAKLGPGVGIVKLIQDTDGQTRAFSLFTTLDGIHGRPFLEGANRLRGKHNTEKSYDEIREEEVNSVKPSVIIVGGGHNGLQAAAHLKALGVEALVIDKNQRTGDNWRLRYKSLSLHDPVWANHLSYLPFPSTWPIFTPSGKLANWLEHYVDVLELNVWNSSEVISTETHFNESRKTWIVSIDRNGQKYEFDSVSHVVLATGLGGGHPKLPPLFKGQEAFQGKITHSSGHGSGADWKDKKALVVGACTSAHDISADFANNGVDVTMLQRSPTFVMSVKKGMPIVTGGYCQGGPDTTTADLGGESIPKFVAKLYHQKLMRTIETEDADLLAGLAKAGFKTTKGEDDSGFLMSALQKAGGYYFDTGASQKIIDGDIKVKQGEINYFTPKGVVYKDGSSAEFDVIVFATGYTGFKDTVKGILGPTYADKLKPVWGLDTEGELRSVCRDCGIPRVYYIVGNLSAARFNTRIAALQIVAEQETGDLKRYSIEKQREKN